MNRKAEIVMMVQLILASGSPRRKELLEQLGLSFDIILSNADESLPNFTTPEEAVKELAYRKAKDVAERVKNALVIGADTLVVCDQKVLGKPENEDDAVQMLTHLQGRSHHVVSGIALIEVIKGEMKRIHAEAKKTTVWMLPLSLDQIEWYIRTGEPLDKAGAYGIQGIGACFIDRIEGCYFNVVGMSLSLLNQMVQQMGYQLLRDFVDEKVK